MEGLDVVAVTDEGNHGEHENPPQGMKSDRVFLWFLGYISVSQIGQNDDQWNRDIPMDNNQIDQEEDEQEN